MHGVERVLGGDRDRVATTETALHWQREWEYQYVCWRGRDVLENSQPVRGACFFGQGSTSAFRGRDDRNNGGRGFFRHKADCILLFHHAGKRERSLSIQCGRDPIPNSSEPTPIGSATSSSHTSSPLSTLTSPFRTCASFRGTSHMKPKSQKKSSSIGPGLFVAIPWYRILSFPSIATSRQQSFGRLSRHRCSGRGDSRSGV